MLVGWPYETIWHLPENVWHLPGTIWHLLETIWHIFKTILQLPKTIWHLPETIWHLPDTICHLSKTIWHLPDTIWHLSKTIWHLHKIPWHLDTWSDMKEIGTDCFALFLYVLTLEGTARYAGFTSSSCGGLLHPAEACFALRAKKEIFMLFWLTLGHVWCSVVTSVTFSSNISNFEKI